MIVMGLFNPYLKRSRLVSLGLIAFIVGGTLGGFMWYVGDIYILRGQPLVRFASEQELATFLRMSPQDLPRSLFEKLQSTFQRFQTTDGRALLPLSPSESNEVPAGDYSMTNIQVAGVDEADIVKTDGEYLYLVSGSVIYIIQAYPPEDAEVLLKLDLKTKIAGIFVDGDKLVVFKTDSTPYEVLDRGYLYYEGGKTSILVYDIANRSSPVLERDLSVDGYYFSSRMIDDYVYVVVSKPASLITNNTANLPQIRSGDTTTKILASDVYHSEIPDYYYYFTNIIAVNAKDATQNATVKTFLVGAACCIYVSRDNIYLVTPGTNIHKINIKDANIDYVANSLVPGYVLNQFSMDEYEGFFRIATSDGQSSSVYVLDEGLNVLGKLEGLAPKERLYSARFMGDRCYLVTFRKVDPLFVIDLKDPGNPQVLGKLKIPGYSDYLHSYDENHLIGVGKETVPAEEDDFSWYQGVKISIFDVSNVSAPKEVAKYEIGDRGTESPVLSDHKAFLFSKSKKLLVLPILLAEIDEAKYPNGFPPYTYGDYVWQGAYVFNISETGLVLKGRVTHLKDETELLKSGHYFDSPYSVKRALYIGDVLYTISDKMIKMNNLENLGEINAVELP